MHTWRQIGRLAFVLSMLAWPASGQTGRADAVKTSELRPTMQSMFQSLTTVLPLSLSAEAFQDAANRQRLHDALRALSSNAARLTQHGAQVPADFDFLRRSLRNDAQSAYELFASGDLEESRFVFQHLTDNCFLCHSRLPSARPFPLGERFVAQLPMQELDPHQRMRLAVAARQFDLALSSCEHLFGSLDIPAAQIDLMGLFEDYLRIAIRVRSDYSRAIRALQTFQQRPDVPRYLSHLLGVWIESLMALQVEPERGSELTQAHSLIQQGQNRNRFMIDRQGMPYFALASGLLHRFVNAATKPKPQLAEAYYLLGVAESYMPRTSWISETDFYLETAVRLAPESPFGQRAFLFLEEYLIMGYTGSSGLHLPVEIQQRLDELRGLIRNAAVQK